MKSTKSLKEKHTTITIRMKGSSILFIGITVLFFAGCVYDKKEVQSPVSSGCDTANMIYNGSIVNIIRTHCYSCHQPGNAGYISIPLDSYTDLKEHVDDGDLVRLINSTDPDEMMPKGGPRLSNCEIAKIEAWVNSGAPE